MQKTSFFAAALFDRSFRASPSSLKRDVNNSVQLLGHMRKISHFWAKMRKDPKCQLGRFSPEPFIWKADLLSVSPSSEQLNKGLMLKTPLLSKSFMVVIQPLSTLLIKPNFQVSLSHQCSTTVS